MRRLYRSKRMQVTYGGESFISDIEDSLLKIPWYQVSYAAVFWIAAWKIGFDSVSVGRKIWRHCNHQLTMLKISIRKKTSYVWSATTPLAYESIRFCRRSGYFSCYLTEPKTTKLAALKSLVSIWELFLSRNKLNRKKYVVEFKLETICYMWLVLYKSAFDKFGQNKTGYLDPIKCWSWVWPGHSINYLPWKKKSAIEWY